jgi:pyruvate formate lyase activating enzyme
MSTLAEVLSRETREGELYDVLPDGRLRCYACGHCCPLPDGAIGVCKVRFNEGGRLLVPWGYVGGVQCDPIEKKPFFHAHPGGLAYSFGMLGCDLHCGYCQNWVTSQALRDPAASVPPMLTSRADLVRDALQQNARVMVSTYNEPLIRASGRSRCSGRQRPDSPPAMCRTATAPAGPQYLRPWVDLYKVDLKSFDDRHYRQLGGRLDPILDTIRRLRAMDFWVEIVTLLIPGFNSSRDELSRLTAFVAGVSPDIPWHVTAFHGDYKMTDPENTTAEMLLEAADIGRASGLRYVYAGNLPGRVGDLEDTRCASCREILIARYGYYIRDADHLRRRCPSCAASVPGRWSTRFGGQIASRPFIPGAGDLQSSTPDERPLRTAFATSGCRSPAGAICAAILHAGGRPRLAACGRAPLQEISALVDVFSRRRRQDPPHGGEPLLRRDLPSLVTMIAAKRGVKDLALTTNGVLLAD